VKAIIGLAQGLGIAVIAEGVETVEQLDLLKNWGCLEVQGFYFARPLAVKDVTVLLRKGIVQPTIYPTARENASGVLSPGAKAPLRVDVGLTANCALAQVW
jgi:predicted signal transduction protein with EAL and GGDEF domain